MALQRSVKVTVIFKKEKKKKRRAQHTRPRWYLQQTDLNRARSTERDPHALSHISISTLKPAFGAGASRLLLEEKLRHSRNAYTTARVIQARANRHSTALGRLGAALSCRAALGTTATSGAQAAGDKQWLSVPHRGRSGRWCRSQVKRKPKIMRAVNSWAVFPIQAALKLQNGVAFHNTTGELKTPAHGTRYAVWHSPFLRLQQLNEARNRKVSQSIVQLTSADGTSVVAVVTLFCQNRYLHLLWQHPAYYLYLGIPAA